MIKEIEDLKKQGLKIGITFSTFEMLHPGHLDMLMQARSQCDYLIVGLLTNPQNDREDKNKPIETSFERYLRLHAVKYVDMIIPFDTERDIENMIKVIKPDIRFCGKEYVGKKHTGWDLCPIIYNDRDHDWSSSSLREKIYKDEAKKLKQQ